MLETMRQNSKSLIIWVLFGIIIAVFIISFGPQADQTASCAGTGGGSYAMEVADDEVSLHSWRFAVNGLGIGSGGSGPQADQRRALALDYLLERELLAQAAEARGMTVSEDVANQAIAAGDFYVMGHRFDGRRVYYKDGAFDYDTLERYASSLGLPNVATLVNEQRRELLAEMMRATILASTRVSEEEARAAYVQQNTTITAQTVLFDLARYERALELDDAQLEAYAKAHAAELEAAWKAEQAEWASDKPRVRIRHIFIGHKNVAAPEPPAAPGPDEGKAAIDAARQKLAGGADFAAVAREVSEDQDTRAQGGRVGWRPAEALGYGKEVVEAVKRLEVGQVSDVIEAADGYHLVKLEARSDKALTFDDKKLDVAARLAPRFYARALARRDAEAALARARTTPLEELFQGEAQGGAEGLPPGFDPKQLLIPQDGAGAAPAGGEQGWIVREGDTRFAQAGGEATAPATPAAPAATAAPAASEPAPGEPLPTAKVEPPTLRSVGPIAREGEFLAGVGESKELVADLFERLEVGQVADRLYETETPDGFAVVKLTARTDADLAAFDKDKATLMARLAEQKSMQALVAWLGDRCAAASKSGEVRVSADVLSVDGDKPAAYQACRNINFMSVLQQLGTRAQR